MSEKLSERMRAFFASKFWDTPLGTALYEVGIPVLGCCYLYFAFWLPGALAGWIAGVVK